MKWAPFGWLVGNASNYIVSQSNYETALVFIKSDLIDSDPPQFERSTNAIACHRAV
jgi:hypothetical protein